MAARGEPCVLRTRTAEAEFAGVNTVNKTMPPSFISLLIVSEHSDTYALLMENIL